MQPDISLISTTVDLVNQQILLDEKLNIELMVYSLHIFNFQMVLIIILQEKYNMSYHLQAFSDYTEFP